MTMQLGTGISSRKRPGDTDGIAVALFGPSQRVLLEGSARVKTLVGTLTSKGREFNLDHVEPTGMFGREMKVELALECMGLSRRKSEIEGAIGVGVQVVLDDLNLI